MCSSDFITAFQLALSVLCAVLSELGTGVNCLGVNDKGLSTWLSDHTG